MADSFTGALTGGLIDPGQQNYGTLAKISEQRRKGLINLGMRQINAIFGGGSVPLYSLETSPLTRGEWAGGANRQPYYFQNRRGEFAPYFAPKPQRDLAYEGAKKGAIAGSVVPGVGNVVGAATGSLIGSLREGDIAKAGINLGTGGSYSLLRGLFGKDAPSPREILNRKIQQGLLFRAPTYQTFEGFQPEFFAKRAQDYVNYALPQVADQYQQNRRALLYGLANRGLSESSVSTKSRSDLERTAGRARQNVADTGLAQADQLRRDIEAARQQSIQQLYQTADPAQASQAAISTAAGFRTPSTFAPVANMFSNLANQYYLNQLLNSYRQPYSSPYGGPTYSLSEALGPVTS